MRMGYAIFFGLIAVFIAADTVVRDGAPLMTFVANMIVIAFAVLGAWKIIEFWNKE